MHLAGLSVPPRFGEGPSWRQLWRNGAFTQLNLVSDAHLSRRAKERGQRLGIGQRLLETFDVQGALQPVAFVKGWNPHAVLHYAPFESHMTFREEEPAIEWSTYAWDSHGRPHTSPLYSPWQLLYVDDALRGNSTVVDLETLLAPTDQRTEVLERRRPLLEMQQEGWRALDAAWRPLMKLLVRLQNRYLPEVTRRTKLVYDTDYGRQVDPWPDERERFDASAAAAELDVSPGQLAEVYWFLVERGIDREPRDGLELLRRARPRSRYGRWRGDTCGAQDHFDAAQVLRLFLSDLTGEPPARAPSWPIDGRQRERAVLYDRGPAQRITREQLQDELVDAGLYPHAVHVVGEGKSEDKIVRRLVSGLLTPRWAEELGFTDLGGAGAASRLSTMVGGFITYAQRTVVIVDSEGSMARYVEGLTRSGDLPLEDVLMFKSNLEEENFSPAEMLDVLIELAANPQADERLPVILDLPLGAVLATHERRCANTGERPGFAGTLLDVAKDPQYGGPVVVSKPDLAEALADRMLRDLSDVKNGQHALQALLERRPLLRFVLDRVIPIFTTASWR